MADLGDSPFTDNKHSFATSRPSRFRPKPKCPSSSASASTTTTKLRTMPMYPVLIPSTYADQNTSSLGTNCKPDPGAPLAGKTTSGSATMAWVDMNEEEEDVVLREIDVFFNPSPAVEHETKLYIMQHPLRPRWRPYDLAERCTQVRMMPKRAKMELDLTKDLGIQNFDQEYPEPVGMEKQTLSSEVAPCASTYAIGVLRESEIYMNPIHSLVQMRPVISSEEQKRKPTSLDSSLASSKMSKKGSVGSKQNEEEEEEEYLVPLEFHPENSEMSLQYAKRMVSRSHSIIDLKMTSFDCMGSLCPRARTLSWTSKERFRRTLMELPLEERMKQLFRKQTISRFEFITYIFARGFPSSEVINVVKLYANLVHGLWVTKSTLLYSNQEDSKYEIHARDFILLQFAKDDFIHFRMILEEFGPKVLHPDSNLKPLFNSLTRRMDLVKKLKFRFPPDLDFMKQFPDVVMEQKNAWFAREERIKENLRRLRRKTFNR